MQSPEKETKGVLLDAEGVQSRRGAKIFTSTEAYQDALRQAGLADDANVREEEQPRAAVAGL